MNLKERKIKKIKRNKRAKIELGYITLTEAAKNFPYSQEYLSLLARQGKIQSKKFGRNWYITQDALDNYLANQGIKIVLPKSLFNTSYKGKITKNFNLLSFGESGSPKIPKVILTQSSEDSVDLSRPLKREPSEMEKKAEPPKVLSEIRPPQEVESRKETLEKEISVSKDEERKKEKIIEKKEKALEPHMIRTMEKDVVKLGGKPKEKKALVQLFEKLKKIPVVKKERSFKEKILKKEILKKEIFKEEIPKKEVPKRAILQIGKIPLEDEEIAILEKKPEREKIIIPKIEARPSREVKPLLKEASLLFPPSPPIEIIPEKKEKEASKEVTVEEKVLERLLQAIEARLGPRGVTVRVAKFNSLANQYFHSTPKAITVSVFAIIILLLLVGGVSFGNLDKTTLAVHNFFKDAETLQGHIPGTHANEVLLLDKNGNISIYGHIETKGQLRSWVQQGVAPMVVQSTTTVDNLSVDYLDNLSSHDFTLAFVTQNGNITYEDVKLEGKVEVGKTLLVKGATKLLDNLSVYGDLGVFGDLEIKGITRALGGIETQGADLNLGSGTIIINNQDLVTNLNADLLDSMHASDFDLHFITSQGSNTYNDISVGGLNVSGFFGDYGSFRLGGGEREVGLIDTRYWGISIMGSFNTAGSIDAGGSLTLGGGATIGGDVNVTGTVTASSFISDDSTTRTSGEEVLRSSVSIFRYDIPAQTSTTTYFRISKYFAQNPLSSKPAVLSGSSRVYRLSFKYNDDLPTASSTAWRVYRVSAAATSSTFALTGQNSTSLEEGTPYITEVLTIPDTDWQVELKLPSADKTIRIFQILLLAFDRID